MNCLIIDDNKMDRFVLKQQVADIDFLNLVGECENAIQAASIMNKEKIDLLLLDIELPKISGIDFIRDLTNRPLVILITSRTDCAIEAFEHNVLDYIVKPLREERFAKAVMKAKEMFDSKTKTVTPIKEYFFFREKGIACKLKISDILYVQAMGDYITIHTIDKRHTIHFTLNAMEKELPNEKFLRVHRSFIAALDKIETVEDGNAYILRNNIPVGNKHRSSLMSRLNML